MRALVVGLDGATFTVLRPLMEAGYLPCIQHAFQRGMFGELLSTIPPITALAWPSFMTGQNPGKHGILGWQEPLNAAFERPWVSSRTLRQPKLWDRLGESGMRLAIVNVPVTYPPDPLNGVMITGLLTPGLDTEFTYPTELKAQLLQAFPGYQLDIDLQHTRRDGSSEAHAWTLLREATEVTRMRGQVAQWLVERERPDFLMVVLELPDRLQHILWRYLEGLVSDPDAAKDDLQRALLECYQVLDEEVGRLLALADDDTYVMLLSDHGFGPWHTEIYLNDWLAEHGWLAYDRTRGLSWDILRSIGRHAKRWLPGTMVRKAKEALPLYRTLDWRRTVAYAGLPTEYGLYLNMEGREPAGLVKPADYDHLRRDIADALGEWRDPSSGEVVFPRIFLREEIYQGPYAELAPDLIFELARGYRVSDLKVDRDLLHPLTPVPLGFHEREGVYGLSGPGIGSDADVPVPSIQDLMPTLLYALGVPVPRDLDGRVMLEIFAPDWRAAHPCRYEDPAREKPAATASPYSHDEARAIEERLRGLGYVE